MRKMQVVAAVLLILSLIFGSLGGLPGAARAAAVSPIAVARGTPDANGVPSTKGQSFTIEGIVTFVVGTKEVYLQDTTAGIDVYGTMSVTPALGDDLLVTGTIGQYDGLTQLAPSAASIQSSGNQLPAPVSVTAAQANSETYEGALAAVSGKLTVAATPVPKTAQFTVTDGSSSLLVYLKGWKLASAPTAGAELSLVQGILSQYDSSSPYTSGYELLARSSGDLTFAAFSVATASLPAGMAGVSYTATLAAGGGVPPYTWSGTGIPAGLTLSAAGVLSGTPAADGTFTLHLTATDATTQTVSADLPLTILPCVTPIGTARTMTGKSVTVRGVVTAVMSGNNVYIQDATGAIVLYSSNGYTAIPQVGQTMTATGQVSSYKGNLEVAVTTPAAASLSDPSLHPVAPLPLDLSQVTTSTHQQELIQVTGQVLSVAPASYTAVLTDGSTTLQVYFNKNSTASLGSLAAGVHYAVTGVLTQYNNVPQILPRFQSDIVQVSVPVQTITSNAGAHGSISPSGTVTVPVSGNMTFSVTADPGYVISQLLVDGSEILSARKQSSASYTFSNVTADHTISVTFCSLLTGVPSLTLLNMDSQHGWTTAAGGVPSLLTRAPVCTISFDAEADTGAVTVAAAENGKVLAQTVADGDGTLVLSLADGLHHMTIVATSGTGMTTSESLVITVDVHGPQLVLDQTPSSTTDASLEIRGLVTDAVSGVTRVTVNDMPVVRYSDGSFDEQVSLTMGSNTITVVACDEAGNVTRQDFTVVRKSETAATGNQLIILNVQIGSTAADDQGMPLVLDAAPFLRAGRTFLPVRAVIEAFGGSVSWNSPAQSATICLGGRTVTLTIGRNIAVVDGRQMVIDPDSGVVPVIVKGRVFLPLQFVADALGISTAWDAVNHVVTLSYWP